MLCIVQSCKNNESCISEGISFHRFPRTGIQLKAWVKALGLSEDFTWSMNKFVCSDHFLKEDIIDHIEQPLKKLRKGAIPSLHLDTTLCPIPSDTTCHISGPGTSSEETSRILVETYNSSKNFEESWAIKVEYDNVDPSEVFLENIKSDTEEPSVQQNGELSGNGELRDITDKIKVEETLFLVGNRFVSNIEEQTSIGSHIPDLLSMKENKNDFIDENNDHKYDNFSDSVDSTPEDNQYGDSDAEIITQIKNNNGDNTIQLEYPYFDYSPPESSNWNVHMSVEYHEMKKFQCEYCDYSSDSFSSLKRHTDSVHHQIKNYNCKLCDYSATRSSHLDTHISAVHHKLKRYVCEMCGQRSVDSSSLKKHIDTVHHKLRNHKCKYCDFSTATSGHVKRHIDSVHYKIKNHKCKHCDYSTSRHSNLKVHINAVHKKLKEFKCEFCDVTTHAKGHLKIHIDAVHFRLKNNKCEFCDYITTQTSTLRQHVKSVHFKIKDFKCEHCDYTSSRSNYLGTHVRTVHEKVKNHKCDYCKYSASRSGHLKRHIKCKHPEENDATTDHP